MAEVVDVRDQKYYKPRRNPPDRDVKVLFRFEPANVEWIANYFLGQAVESRGGVLSSDHKMKICLRYLAIPGYQSGIAEELGVSQGTVSITVSAVVEKIVASISFPNTLL